MKIEEMEKMPKVAIAGHTSEKGYVTQIRHTKERQCGNGICRFDPTSWTNLCTLIPDTMEATANFVGTPAKYEVKTAYKVMNRKGKVTLYVKVCERSSNNYSYLVKNTFNKCNHPFDQFFADTIKLGSYQLTKDDFEMRSEYAKDEDDIILKRKFGEWLTNMINHSQATIQAKMDDYMKQFSKAELKAITAAKTCIKDLVSAQSSINKAFDAVAGLVIARSSMCHIDKKKVSELDDMIESTLENVVNSIIYINKVEKIYNVVDELEVSHHHDLKPSDVRNKIYQIIEGYSDNIKYDVEHISSYGFSGYDLHKNMALSNQYANSFTGIYLPEMHVKIK